MTVIRRPIVLSFFSGVDGAGKGLTKAGYETKMSTDYEPKAKIAWENNLPGNHHSELHKHLISEGKYYVADMFDANFAKKYKENYTQHYGRWVHPQEVDLVVGGPPCVDSSPLNRKYSSFGKNNELIFIFLKFVLNEIKPKQVLMEQVPSILTFKRLCHLKRRLIHFLNSYNNEYDWEIQVLNAADYGANQERKRMILIMHHKSMNVPVSFPKPIQRTSAQQLKSLIPSIACFTQKVEKGFDEYGSRKKTKWKSANRILHTLTATGGEKVMRNDGTVNDYTLEELLLICQMPKLNLSNLGRTAQHRLLGNMVLIEFAYHLGLTLHKSLQEAEAKSISQAA